MPLPPVPLPADPTPRAVRDWSDSAAEAEIRSRRRLPRRRARPGPVGQHRRPAPRRHPLPALHRRPGGAHRGSPRRRDPGRHPPRRRRRRRAGANPGRAHRQASAACACPCPAPRATAPAPASPWPSRTAPPSSARCGRCAAGRSRRRSPGRGVRAHLGAADAGPAGRRPLPRGRRPGDRCRHRRADRQEPRRQAGFDRDEVGGHSLKRGALTTGMDRGVHPTRPKQFGRQKSYAVLDGPLLQRDGVRCRGAIPGPTRRRTKPTFQNAKQYGRLRRTRGRRRSRAVAPPPWRGAQTDNGNGYRGRACSLLTTVGRRRCRRRAIRTIAGSTRPPEPADGVAPLRSRRSAPPGNSSFTKRTL